MKTKSKFNIITNTNIFYIFLSLLLFTLLFTILFTRKKIRILFRSITDRTKRSESVGGHENSPYDRISHVQTIDDNNAQWKVSSWNCKAIGARSFPLCRLSDREPSIRDLDS